MYSRVQETLGLLTINLSKKNYKAKFVVEDEKTAAFDLFLSATTLDLQAVKNLFSNDQAERIEKWVFKIIDTKDWGEYAIDEVKKYDEEFQKGLQNINEGTGGPLSAVTARLVRCAW